MHGLRLGLDCSERRLNDLDFITAAFAGIPETLAQDFLFRHIHASAQHGKTMLQMIDRANALRIDVFRACGETMNRTMQAQVPLGPLRIVSLEDLVARAARLLFDLAESVPVASKHASDYLRFVEFVGSHDIEAAWHDHPKPFHTATFREVKTVLRYLIPARANLVITPEYSQDSNEVCRLCAATNAFQLADPKVVLSLLGYC